LGKLEDVLEHELPDWIKDQVNEKVEDEEF